MNLWEVRCDAVAELKMDSITLEFLDQVYGYKLLNKDHGVS